MSSSDPNELKTEVQVLKQQRMSLEAQTHQQGDQIRTLTETLRLKENRIEELTNQNINLQIRWETLNRDMTHVRIDLERVIKESRIKEKKTKMPVILGTMLFLLSSVLVNLGTTMTSSPSSFTTGMVILGLAAACSLIGAIVTIALTSGGKS